jgi:hypothetical protein
MLTYLKEDSLKKSTYFHKHHKNTPKIASKSWTKYELSPILYTVQLCISLVIVTMF